MIDVKAKIHDKFSIEFKVGYVVKRKLKENKFALNTWIFVPNSLDINPMTYSKTEFYRDIKTNIRLITPIFLLREIADGNAIPLNNLEKSFHALASDPSSTNIKEYEYQIKMFSAIFKSAVRDEVIRIMNNPLRGETEYLCTAYVNNIRSIRTKFRELKRIINVPTVEPEVMNYYLFGDEFISNTIEQHNFRLLSFLENKRNPKYDDEINEVKDLTRQETEYKISQGYLVAEKDNPVRNRELLYRYGMLKKYIESDLFLNARKKKDGVLVEQIYYSIAAGLSMIFATTIAFSVQQKYGNFTMPLFVALVVSYMLKDRIKELMRYYFAYRLKDKYFDNKTTISMKGEAIGWCKEGVDFITDEKTPQEVLEIRSRSALLETENRNRDEKVLLYRKSVLLDRETMEQNSEYSVAGVNDISRFYINRLVEKTDNPEVPIRVLDENDSVSVILGEKAYYLNIIMQLQFEEQTDYKRFRAVFNRMGISQLEELK